MFEKPKFKRRVPKAKNNPVPTANDICIYCGTPYASTHEAYEGTGRRQISIQHKFQVKVCNDCHADIHAHPLTGRDLELKQHFQAKFEQTHSRQEFIDLIGRNFL